MRLPKTLSFFFLATALVYAPPAWAQQKSVRPNGAGRGPNAVRPYVACAAKALPARGRKKSVAPGCRPARANVAASLPRHGGVKPPLGHANLKVSAKTSGTAPAKPFTQEQVVSMVRDGFGDESGAKLIERGELISPHSRILANASSPRPRSRHFLTRCAPPSPPSSRARGGRSTHCWYSPFWWAKRIVS